MSTPAITPTHPAWVAFFSEARRLCRLIQQREAAASAVETIPTETEAE